MYRSFFLISTVIIAVGLFSGCRPKYPNCKKDSHCKEGEYCVNNLCQQCRDSGDCPKGQECKEGACSVIEGYCSSSADCADGQICRENRCGPCLSAEDCEGGNVCLDGKCQKAECQSTQDCPAGLSCIGYRCKTDEGAFGTQSECRLETIYFEFDSSEVSSDMRTSIQNNFECLKKRGGDVKVEGHCDPRGTTEYNMGLGDRRARIVSKILKTLGFDESKVRVVSKGEEEATGTNEAGWEKDRKVEFR